MARKIHHHKNRDFKGSVFSMFGDVKVKVIGPGDWGIPSKKECERIEASNREFFYRINAKEMM